MSILRAEKNLHGTKVIHYKNTMDNETTSIDTPKKVTIPMLQHMGASCEPIVAKGDKVYVGTKIGDSKEYFSVPIHASCSGEVTDIIDYNTISGVSCKAVVITTDGKQAIDPSISVPAIKTRDELIAATRESGLVGLGGAGFPTFMKFAYKDIDKVTALVINAAECEPFITSDYRECLENSDNILAGIELVTSLLNIENVYVGIEDNKPQAIDFLADELLNLSCNANVVKLPSIYPQGAEKSIIYATTGIVVEQGKLPADHGVIVMNISSIGFLGKYSKDGLPLVSKRITVDGDCVDNPQNLLVPIGTSIEEILDFCEVNDECAKILMGGPMMGLPVIDYTSPIIKNNNAIIALSKDASKSIETTACIRCGKCITVCPMNLMPAKLEKFYDNKNVDGLEKFCIDLCINCGCCSYICPAHRHLTQKNQLAKSLVKAAKKGGK